MATSPAQQRSAAARTLGVDPAASRADIRLAFQRLAKRLHPDVNPAASADGGGDAFRLVKEAYDTLRDAAVRQGAPHTPAPVDPAEAAALRRRARIFDAHHYGTRNAAGGMGGGTFGELQRQAGGCTTTRDPLLLLTTLAFFCSAA